MKEYIESFKTAYQIATTFLFFVPYTCKRQKNIARKIASNR